MLVQKAPVRTHAPISSTGVGCLGIVDILFRGGLPPPDVAGFIPRPEPSCSYVPIDEDRISIGVHSDEAGPIMLSPASCCNYTPWASSRRRSSRTSVNVANFRALLSHPGLKVRMFCSNIP